MITPAQVDRLKGLPEWQALEAHLHDCVEALDSCLLIPDTDDHEKAARGRKYAVQIILKILEPFQYDPSPVTDRQKESLKKLGMI